MPSSSNQNSQHLKSIGRNSPFLHPPINSPTRPDTINTSIPKRSRINTDSTSKYSIKCFYTNPTSITNKINELKTRLTPPDCPDLIFICETWFKPDSPLHIDGYTLFHLSRECAKGGVAIYTNKNLITYQVSNKEINIAGSEQIWCGITIGKERLLAGCIYRPPSSSETVNIIINNSIKRAKSLVDQGKFTLLLIVGDFNRHISWTSTGGLACSHDDTIFLENINANLLTQFVLEPTLGNNQLDLILSDDPGSIFNVEVAAPLGCSDKNNYHSTLRWNFFVKDKQISQQNIVRPDFKRGDYGELGNYLRNISWLSDLKSLSVDEA